MAAKLQIFSDLTKKNGKNDYLCSMKKIFLLTIAATIAAVSLAQQRLLDWGDQHNGTYKNPVLNADYSDPDVIRVDDKYYMVASDFHFIGMQVLESYDLVNWHIISQIYDRFDLPGWDENGHYGGGSWAPSIRYHDGLYYVYFCTPDEGLFMSTASNPHGPWSPLHCLKAVEKWEDPCPFWDDDGKAYLGRSQWGAGPIIVHRMTPDGKTLLDDGVTVYTGPVAEGTKFLKRNGYYYLIIPEGGVGTGWQTVLRSRNIYGPYERRIVLEQGSTNVNGPHQGALVDTPDGIWWFFHFQETHPTGRVVHLQPARWVDDWPLIGVDIDGNGIGEPVAEWTSPSTPHLPPSTSADELSSSGLPLTWQWNHNPVDSAWHHLPSLGEGGLSFHILPAATMKDSRNMLTQKTVGYESEATVRIDVSQMHEGDHAGLLCMGKQFMGAGVCLKDGQCYFYFEDDNQPQLLGTFEEDTVYLRVTIDSRNNLHQFSVSLDGSNFRPVGHPFALRMGYWKGSRIGVYSYATSQNPGHVIFSDFRYDVTR